MKALLSILVIVGSSHAANAQVADGVYKVAGLSCASGAPVNAGSSNAAIAAGTFLNLNQGNVAITIKMGGGCEINFKGSFSVAGNTLKKSALVASATPQCGQLNLEAAPAGTATYSSTADTLTVTEKVDTQDANGQCNKGDSSVVVYKKIL